MSKPYREPPSVGARQDSFAEWTCEGKPKDFSSRGDVARVKRDRIAAITAAARAECALRGEFGWYRRIDVSCPM